MGGPGIGSSPPVGGMAPVGAAMAQGAPPAGPDEGLQALAGQIRQIGQSIQALAASQPILAEEAQQIAELLKAMVVKAAQAQSMQTQSGMAVPGQGGGA